MNDNDNKKEQIEYVLVRWPETKIVAEQEWFPECELVLSAHGVNLYGHHALLAPKHRMESLIIPSLQPKLIV